MILQAEILLIIFHSLIGTGAIGFYATVLSVISYYIYERDNND